LIEAATPPPYADIFADAHIFIIFAISPAAILRYFRRFFIAFIFAPRPRRFTLRSDIAAPLILAPPAGDYCQALFSWLLHMAAMPGCQRCRQILPFSRCFRHFHTFCDDYMLPITPLFFRQIIHTLQR
jgi:hypothetical protein